MPFSDRVRGLQRWRHVQAILLRYGFDILIDQEEIRDARRLLREKLRLPVGEFDGYSTPQRVRLMLQELGPTCVKLGQIMASRSDLLPGEWVTELAKLQDEVAPFPYEQVREAIVQELGAPPEELFDRFDPQPAAAASLGQVHRARLADRRLVVVKVQRPGVESQVRADITIMHEIARLIEAHTAWGRDYGVVDVAEEFARTLLEELDYLNEARNADRLRANLRAFPRVRVPAIYWDLVTPHVLTMEEVRGVKINDVEALDGAGIERAELADVFIRSMFQQALVDGWFHADPHPANLLVDLQTGVLFYIDLGMMGRLLEEEREQLGNLVLAALQRDSREVVRIALVIGTPFREVEEAALSRDVDRILNRYLAVSLSELAFSEMLGEVTRIVFEHGVRLPGALTMGVKAMVQAEEVARTLDPEIRIVEIAQTVAQQIAWQRLDPQVLATRLWRDVREGMRVARVFPRALERLMARIEGGDLQAHVTVSGAPEQVRHLTVIANRLTAGLIVAGLAVGSAIAMVVSPASSWTFVPILGTVGFSVSLAVGVLLLGRVLMDTWRTGRRDGKR